MEVFLVLLLFKTEALCVGLDQAFIVEAFFFPLKYW